MSTGSPVSGVDTISSVSHGHGHRPSRGRGHSRSNRWLHGPISHSVSSLDHSAISQPLSQPPETANGSLPDAHGHGHRHTHPHASSIHENGWAASVNHVDAFHTHAPKHSHTGSITGLIPDTPLVSVDPEPTIVLEGPAGIIAALPWIALSWYYQQYVHWESPAPAPGDEVSDDTWTAPSSGRFDHTAQRTGFLTAATIIFLGCAQVFQVVQRGELMPSVPTMGPNEIRSLLGKVCSVALPIYASLKVGGFLVAFALLLATASGLPTAIPDSNAQPGGQARLHQKKLTAGVILTVVLFSFLGMNTSWDTQPFLGYFSLLLSVFIIRPPFSTSISSTSASASGLGISVPGNAFDAKAAPASSPPVTPDEAALTTGSGVLLALATAITSRGISFGAVDFVYILLTAGAFAASLVLLIPSNLRSPHKIGLAIGTGTAAFLCAPPMRDGVYLTYLSRGILAALAFPTARFDDKHLRLSPHSHHHHSHGKEASQLTNLIIRYSEPYPLLYSILKESDSRRIFYFMTLNFSFMLVQLSYGFITGSLGLLSDSIHMFFDCLALVVGLCAAVMSKWPPSSRFPYGYGKVDTLSGFANGIFLMIISIEIIYEAVERLSSGSQMHRLGELLVVSIAGLLVNLVGIMAFDHAHHGHGHDHHGHSHGNENMHGIFLHILADTLGSVAVVISTVLVHYSGWAGYDPIASCMIAILIFASAIPLVSSTAKSLLLTLPADVEYNVRDTLGGVSNLRGVVGYTVPKFWLDDTAASGHDHHHGHGHSHGHDHSHGHSHGHSHDHTHGHNHDHCHDHSHSHSHNNHSHSQSHDHSHAHSHGRDHDHDHDHDHEKTNPNVLGVIHVIASRSADLEDVRQRTVDFLREKNMDILVQVEREGDGRCWCGGGNKSP